MSTIEQSVCRKIAEPPLERPLVAALIAQLTERGETLDLLAIACIRQLSAEIAERGTAPTCDAREWLPLDGGRTRPTINDPIPGDWRESLRERPEGV